ncbi:hypothetical protein IAD21_03765 [Abditibacteriota bacterium]|nr:hypothetical protein IAD21_03765 [Abditibacteriota bacterium]
MPCRCIRLWEGSWLNIAKSVPYILARPHSHWAQEVIAWLETDARAWNREPAPCMGLEASCQTSPSKHFTNQSCVLSQARTFIGYSPHLPDFSTTAS